MKGLGLTVVVVGGPNQGKSKFVIEAIEKSDRENFIYDHRREYIEKHRISEECAMRSTVFYNLTNFRNNINNFEYSNIVAEEASVWLNYYRQEDLMDVLTGIFHRGNTLYMLFHAYHIVPSYVYDQCHFIRCYKTGEDIGKLKASNPKIFKLLSTRQQFPFTYQNQEYKF